jgi:hypothetical protein
VKRGNLGPQDRRRTANMKNQSPALRQIIVIFVIGLVISTILGDFNLGGLFSGTADLELKSLFDTLSNVLAVIAILLGTAYLVYRTAQGKDEAVWTEWDEGE